MTHSIAPKSALNEWEIERKEMATMLESRLIMNDGIDVHSSTPTSRDQDLFKTPSLSKILAITAPDLPKALAYTRILYASVCHELFGAKRLVSLQPRRQQADGG
jgi:hypothetical protein